MNCPLCETHVWDHEPGVSYVTYAGAKYHPHCLYAERPDLREDEGDGDDAGDDGTEGTPRAGAVE